jgi:hypothetical protein
MPPSRTATDAIANEFGAYYHVDELPPVTGDGFDVAQRAAESAERLRYTLDDPAEAAALLRAAAEDREHPLIGLIAKETVLDWQWDDDAWRVLQQLLRGIADDLER